MADSDRIRIVERQVLSKAWASLTRTILDYRRADGRWQRLTRETFDHGHGAAILLYDLARRTVILVRQFRLPAFLNGESGLSGDNGFLIEVPAGLLDGMAPQERIRAEAEEETGFSVGAPRQVFAAYMSPGSLTEIIHCFVAPYEPAQRTSAGGGLEAEGEDIEILEMDFEAALAAVADGRIRDAKTIMLLQHAALHLFAPR